FNTQLKYHSGSNPDTSAHCEMELRSKATTHVIPYASRGLRGPSPEERADIRGSVGGTGPAIERAVAASRPPSPFPSPLRDPPPNRIDKPTATVANATCRRP
ncbi:hypothetical protein GWI33_001321, partial [Rhynchophorus ferrugineus]